jgi:hypothetical protein
MGASKYIYMHFCFPVIFSSLFNVMNLGESHSSQSNICDVRPVHILQASINYSIIPHYNSLLHCADLAFGVHFPSTYSFDLPSSLYCKYRTLHVSAKLSIFICKNWFYTVSLQRTTATSEDWYCAAMYVHTWIWSLKPEYVIYIYIWNKKKKKKNSSCIQKEIVYNKSLNISTSATFTIMDLRYAAIIERCWQILGTTFTTKSRNSVHVNESRDVSFSWKSAFIISTRIPTMSFRACLDMVHTDHRLRSKTRGLVVNSLKCPFGSQVPPP